MTLRKVDIGAVIVLSLAIIAAAVWLGRLEGRVSSLESNLQKPFDHIYKIERELINLNARIESLTTKMAKVEKNLRQDTANQPTNEDVKIPLEGGWRPQGSITNGGGGFKEGILELKANLRGGDSYAELFLDLRAVRLPGVTRNPDGSYNLAGRELMALVKSSHDFKGNPSHPNGAQFLLKNDKWENLIGTWLNITDAMLTTYGMEVFFTVPDNRISKNVAGISLKFTIGSSSNSTYQGSFFVKDIKIR